MGGKQSIEIEPVAQNKLVQAEYGFT